MEFLAYVMLREASGSCIVPVCGRVVDSQETNLILAVLPAVIDVIKEGSVKSLKVGETIYEIGFAMVPVEAVSGSRPRAWPQDMEEALPSLRADGHGGSSTVFTGRPGAHVLGRHCILQLRLEV